MSTYVCSLRSASSSDSLSESELCSCRNRLKTFTICSVSRLLSPLPSAISSRRSFHQSSVPFGTRLTEWLKHCFLRIRSSLLPISDTSFVLKTGRTDNKEMEQSFSSHFKPDFARTSHFGIQNFAKPGILNLDLLIDPRQSMLINQLV